MSLAIFAHTKRLKPGKEEHQQRREQPWRVPRSQNSKGDESSHEEYATARAAKGDESSREEHEAAREAKSSKSSPEEYEEARGATGDESSHEDYEEVHSMKTPKTLGKQQELMRLLQEGFMPLGRSY